MSVAAYVDTSALVKLVHTERETPALRGWLASDACPQVLATSLLTAVELVRACRRAGSAAVPVAQRVLAAVSQVSLTPAVVQRAAILPPDELRSLDAIHLATALTIGPSLVAFVAYDVRLLRAADAAGLPTLSP